MNTINVRETDPPTHDAPPPVRQRDRWVPPLVAMLLLLIVLASLLFWLPLDQPGGAGTSEQNGNGASAASDGNGRGRQSLGGAGTGQAGNDAGSTNHGDAFAAANAGDSTGSAPNLQAPDQAAHPLAATGSPALSEQAHATASSNHIADAPPDQPALPDLGFRSNLTAPPPPEVSVDVPIVSATASSAMDAGPAGNAGLASFFGQTGHGSRFVFVIDRSGSMSGAAFAAAQFELIRSLRSLRPHESFYIIFYDNDAMPMPANGLVRATPANIERFVEWLRQVGTGGGTNPTEAMITALSRLKPDTIWLLSDGAFNVGVAETITRHNPQRRIHINTIAFKNRSGEAILKIIADENKGDYRFVDPP